MQPFVRKQNYRIEDLIEIVRLLREPDGCPWDREQDHRSLRSGFIEETYETVDAIDKGSVEMLREELGDVLLQVVFHAQIETENGCFDFDDVCDGICKKLLYRHPHVFSVQENPARTTEQVLEKWDQLKDVEKDIHTAQQDIAAVPAALPALMRARKVQKRAGRHGFTWPDATAAMTDLNEELDELREAMASPTDREQLAAEYGDVLFSLTNLGRLLDLEAEQALTDATNRFAGRLARVEQGLLADGRAMKDCSADELLRAWEQAK